MAKKCWEKINLGLVEFLEAMLIVCVFFSPIQSLLAAHFHELIAEEGDLIITASFCQKAEGLSLVHEGQ